MVSGFENKDYRNGFDEGYDKGKADGINEFMDALCEDCKKQPCYGDKCYQKIIAEQLKEGK